jgi:hypothetical protein
MVDQSSALKAGKTFFNSIRSRRLWVVANPPDEAGSVIVFPIFPFSDRCDGTCILPAGCHPRLTDCDYAVDYDGAKTLTAENQTFLAEHGFLSWQASFDAQMTRKIQQGAVDSDCTPTGYQKILARLLVRI